jgi:hypothetical protein
MENKTISNFGLSLASDPVGIVSFMYAAAEESFYFLLNSWAASLPGMILTSRLFRSLLNACW